jgi:hypothetical protein
VDGDDDHARLRLLAEERLLAFLLAPYVFAIFGYIMATIASHFVKGDIDDEPAPLGEAEGIDDRLTAQREEIAMLRSELAAISARLERQLDPYGQQTMTTVREPKWARVSRNS